MVHEAEQSEPPRLRIHRARLGLLEEIFEIATVIIVAALTPATRHASPGGRSL